MEFKFNFKVIHSHFRGLNRVRRQTTSPSDVLRLLKQPVGQAREIARAADYMSGTLSILRRSLSRRQKRSINATGTLYFFFLSADHLNMLDTTAAAELLLFFPSSNQIWSLRNNCRPSPSCRAAPHRNGSLPAPRLPTWMCFVPQVASATTGVAGIITTRFVLNWSFICQDLPRLDPV